jgi:hypothetical protein
MDLDIELKLSKLEAKSLLSLLNRLWNMGSYDYVFPTEADEKRAMKLTKQLEKYLNG